MSKYDDILNMKYEKSKLRPHMSIENRAGQFSSFNALKGYEQYISNSTLYIEPKKVLFDDQKDRIYNKLENIDNKMIIVVYYNKIKYIEEKLKCIKFDKKMDF